mmetsp:Transcript_132388/g.229583  ORF Transcript_132388/g.229583 Transcript_132388/m.229583 type:complete len:635 (-) Transcript_132388:943-2847(-)
MLEPLFYPLLAARILSALYAPINDCDEVFNFWEPTHYLLYGEGFQPWEYSPQYALRSWLYVVIHYCLFVPFKSRVTKVQAFYMLRIIIGLITMWCERQFIKSVHLRFGKRVAGFLYVLSMFSPAMFVATTAYLPTSFAMCCFMVAHGAWFMEHYSFVAHIIAAASVGTVIGWPFAALAMVPTAWDVIAGYGFKFTVKKTWPLFIVCWLSNSVDTEFYRFNTLSAYNLIFYNVLSGDSEGSELYGVEPWYFFFKNLALNFNLAFALALAAPLLLLARSAVWMVWYDILGWHPKAILELNPMPRPKPKDDKEDKASPNAKDTPKAEKKPGLRRRGKRLPTDHQNPQAQAISKQESDEPEFELGHVPYSLEWLMYITPFLLWFCFWTGPKHKEERFMTPVYHMLLLAAAMGLDCIYLPLKFLFRRLGVMKLSSVLVGLLLFGVFVPVSVLRIVGQVKYYGAPFEAYRAVAQHYERSLAENPFQFKAGEYVKVCVGKEWYRFPSHFHLHPHMKMYFIRSGFNGLLPTHFDSSPNGNGTYHEQPLLNHHNKAVWELPSIVNVSECQYLVDLDLPDQKEEHFPAQTDTWEVVGKYPFLDAGRSPQWARILWIPSYSDEVNVYASYYALKRKAVPTPADEG